MRKLSIQYHFKIDLTDSYVKFTDLEGKEFASWKKLTKSQWEKASKYLDRKLIAFVGYNYSVKPEHKDKKIIIIK